MSDSNHHKSMPELPPNDEARLTQVLKEIAEEEVPDTMDVWLSIESQLKLEQESRQPLGERLHRVMQSLIPSAEDRARNPGFIFWATAAVLILGLGMIVGYLLQPDYNSLSTIIIPQVDQTQDTEVDCLADRAYRVVYPEELGSLTTEDLKCVLIVGDLREADINHLDFSNTMMRDVNMSGMDLRSHSFERGILINADFRGADLTNVDFRGAQIIEADFSCAVPNPSEPANCEQSTILNSAKFDRTGLINADFGHAELTDANLNNSDLRGTRFDYADLSNATMEWASSMNASYRQSRLIDANLNNAVFTGSFMVGAEMMNAVLVGANLNMTRLGSANLSGANLSTANLAYSGLQRTNFANADLSKAFLYYVYLLDGNLSGANLSNAVLLDADIEITDLAGADLSGVDLSGMEFQNQDLTRVNLQNAILIGSDLSNSDLSAANLNGANLTQAILTDVTLPDGTLWTEEADLTRFTNPDHPDYWRSEDAGSPAYGGES